MDAETHDIIQALEALRGASSCAKSPSRFGVCNAAGGDLRQFRILTDEYGNRRLSDAAIVHARRQGYGGAYFCGRAAAEAAELFDSQ